ncbi:MAG: hypothetical protein ACR2ID_10165 [Chthoniobacterales bacterium]
MAASNSLIIAEEEKERNVPSEDQLSFFHTGDFPRIDRSAHIFNCTGERLFRDRRDIYELAVRLLAEPGMAWRQIMRTCHLSYPCLVAVSEREKIPIATAKREILRSVTRGLRMCAERVEELAPEMSARDALVGVGILGEKLQLLNGEATAFVEVSHSAGNNFAALAEMASRLETLAREEKTITARVVESETLSDMGSAGEMAEQTGGTLIAPEEVVR